MGRGRPKKADTEVAPYWKDTPEWKRSVDKILKMKERGFNDKQIAEVMSMGLMEVKRVIEEEEVTVAIAKKQWGEKIPVMQDIVAMGLDGMRETLKEMADPEVRRRMVKGISELKSLMSVVEGLNMLIRLEEGKSTQNIANQHLHSFQETRAVLRDLATVDPVFEYNVDLKALDMTDREIFEKNKDGEDS